MRNLDANLSAEFAKSVFTYIHMVEIYLTSGTYRYTDFQHEIYSGGNKYLPKGLDIGSIGSNLGLAIDKVTFELDDTDLTVSALFLGEDVRYKRVSIYKGAIDANFEIIAIDEFFRGVIESWELPEPRAKIIVANELVKWKDKPLRPASATCPWVFNKPPHTNLITNGTFDSDITGWNDWGAGTGSWDASGYSGGCLQIAAGSGPHNSGSTQVITVSPGKLHTLRFRYKNTAGDVAGYFVYAVTHSFLIQTYTQLASSTSWGDYYILNFGVPLGCTSIEVGFISWNNTDIVWIDSIEVYAVTECAYLGDETWCDQSYARCVTLGNSDNFGGFRFLPSLMEKDIWWGKVPK
jgi:hypothetical protein